jgi:mitotic spindle assembly checkpoint protein MAD2B
MRKGSDLGGVKSFPVRLVEAGAFVLEMWIEEGKAKKKDRG